MVNVEVFSRQIEKEIDMAKTIWPDLSIWGIKNFGERLL